MRRGTIINAAGFVTQFVCTLLLTPMVVSHLGKAGYGVWILANSFGGYYGLVNLGLSSALVRYISLHSARQETDETNRIVSTAFVFFSCTGALVCLASVLFAGQLADFFPMGLSDAAEFEKLVRLFGFSTALEFVAALFTAVLNSHERHGSLGLVNLGRTLLRFATVLALLQLGFGVVGLGVASLLMAGVMLTSNIWLARRVDPHLRIRFGDASFRVLGTLLRYGTSTFLMNVVNLARTKIGHLILAKTVGLTAVALFGVAGSVVLQFYSMLSSSLGALTARFVRLDATKKQDEMRLLFRKALFVAALLSFGFGLMIFLFGKRFLLLWVGKDFIAAAPALFVLTAAYVLALCQSPGWNVMFGVGKHHFMAVTSVVEAVITVVLATVLARPYGATGAAWGTAAGMLLTKVFIQPVYVARLLEMPLWRYMQPILAPALVAIVLFGVAELSGAAAYFDRCPLPAWFVAGAAIGGLYLGLTLLATAKTSFFVNPLPQRLRRA